MRKIAHVISLRGFCSRRFAEKLVLNEKVRVNGLLISNVAEKIDENSNIEINDFTLKVPQTRLWTINKPVKVLSSHKSQKEFKTIFDYLPDLPYTTYIGRLDYMSEGLMLLTNNPKLVNLMQKFERVYEVIIHEKPNKEFFKFCNNPIIDNIKYMPIICDKLYKYEKFWKLRLRLFEGKNREIRNICKYFQLKIIRLIRISYGPFNVPKILCKEVNFSIVNKILLDTL